MRMKIKCRPVAAVSLAACTLLMGSCQEDQKVVLAEGIHEVKVDDGFWSPKFTQWRTKL